MIGVEDEPTAAPTVIVPTYKFTPELVVAYDPVPSMIAVLVSVVALTVKSTAADEAPEIVTVPDAPSLIQAFCAALITKLFVLVEK